MRAVRFLVLAVLLVTGVAGKAFAQLPAPGTYFNTPGTYEGVRVGVVPAALPPGSLPSDLPGLGPDLYEGTLTISLSGGIYTAQFKGERLTDGLPDGAKLNAQGTFSSAWVGVKLGNLPVGSSLEPNCITGIDGAHLLSANINGVGTVTPDGGQPTIQRVIARFTSGPTLAGFKVNPAPGNLR